jgi:glycosyltransferase involved in cell wall biosynthesis
LSDPDVVDLSLLVLHDGWVHDVARLHASANAHLTCTWELVVIDNPVDEEASEQLAALDRSLHIPLKDRLGFGAGRNLALRQATGRIVAVVDASVEIEGNLWTPLEVALADPDVGLVGRWGVDTENGFDFSDASGPDVAGVEGYFMAMRRADLARTGLFDPKFRFYRNADIDFTYQVRDKGLRTVIDTSLPLARHTHRLWENTPDRDALSRENFGRFRRHWFASPS